jgi:uncharacterized repeat protein (TIGR04138 family)
MELMNEEFDYIVSQICEEDPRYHLDAYEFVMEALSFAQKKFKREKHISGEEFLEGIKALLLKKFGPMTLTVLSYWGIKKTEDFGQIVFNLEQYKIIAKDNQDHYETFKNGYDFQQVFDEGYRKELAKRLKSMRY